MTRQISFIVLVTALVGCATHYTACPALVDYSLDFQKQVAEELFTLPDGSALADAMADYSVLRQQVRACQ